MRSATFALTCLFAVMGCATVDRSTRITNALVPVARVKGSSADARFELAARMAYFGTPGVSIAVVDGGKLVWARGFGTLERGSSTPVTTTTLFQAASISKVVTATATLRLVDSGKLSLDADVNGFLTSWKVPENEFTRTEKVTLRRLMSHTAGINLGGFLGYPRSSAKLPTVPQILDGLSPANTGPVRVTAIPGSTLSYSGGGVMIEQLVLMDVTGTPFPQLMRELVLMPAGMRSSTFEQPRSPAIAHDASGAPLPDRFRVYPELAAAGLWSTPSDLVAWAMAVAAPTVLSPASAKEMLTPQKGPLGLGPIVRGEGRSLRFGHAGWAEGAHAEVIYFPELGKGAAVMLNGAAGRPLVREILFAIAAEYGWPGFEPDVIERAEVEPSVQDALVGRFAVTVDGNEIVAEIVRDGEHLTVNSMKLGLHSKIVFVSKTSFVALDTGDAFAFTRGDNGAIVAIDWGGVVLKRESPK
ncbi:MAG: beta-lactamase family protein [Archangium sp.]|nr:beta-lactamase family protein [Archangium sp.]